MVERRWIMIGLLAFGGLACAGAETPPAQMEETPEPSTAETAEVPMIEIPNGILVEGGILSAGQPDEAGLQQAADAGYRTIVNLRGPGEEGELAGEAELVRELGMAYVEIPITGAEAYTEENARLLSDALTAEGALPAVVHCRSGNRVGVLLALKAFHVDGVEGPAALELGFASGAKRIPDHVLEALGTHAD